MMKSIKFCMKLMIAFTGLTGTGVFAELPLPTASPPATSLFFRSNETIRIFEMEPTSNLSRRVGVRILSPDGTERVYELKTMSIGEEPFAQTPEWAKQFQTLGGVEIRIPLSSSPSSP